MKPNDFFTNNQWWIPVSVHNRCRICGKPDWCVQLHTGEIDVCRRVEAGALKIKTDNSGAEYYVHRGPNFDEGKTETEVIFQTKKNIQSQQKESKPDFYEDLKESAFETETQRLSKHEIYSKLINACPLFDDQEEGLLERGFSKEDLYRFGSTRSLSNDTVRNLFLEYGEKRLKEVPGLYLEEHDGIVRYNPPRFSAIMIPSMSRDGLIQGIKLRKDHVRGNEPRYTSFSSSHQAGGAKARPYIHYVNGRSNTGLFIITEGELKGDLIHKFYPNHMIMAMPGVSFSKKVVNTLASERPQEILLGFDKDVERKPSVFLYALQTFGSLKELGIPVKMAYWDSEKYKGLDDALIAREQVIHLNTEDALAYLRKCYDSNPDLQKINFDEKLKGFPKDTPEYDDEWCDDPQSPITNLPLLPKIEEDDIPESLRTFVIGEARRKSVAVEFILVSFFAVLASLIGRRLGLKPKKLDSWVVVPVFWAMVVGRPSSRKTPAIGTAMRFLINLSEELKEDNQRMFSEWMAEKEILEQERQDLLHSLKGKKNSKEAKDDTNLRERIKEKLTEISHMLTYGKPPYRKLFVSDATKEKIVEILRENPHGILNYRDELSGWFASLTQKGAEALRAFFLEAFNGDHPYTEERKTRESIELSAVTVSILGGIQPGVVAQHILRANAGGLGNDGLMARFSGMVFPDRVEFEYIDEPPSKEEYQKILNMLRKLRDFDANKVEGCEVTTSGLPFVEFDDEAQNLFISWLQWHEKRLQAENLSEGLEAHLGKYTKAVCTLALTFHLLAWADQGEDARLKRVTHKALTLAIRWSSILEGHARVIYDGLAKKSVASSFTLLEHIEAGDVTHLMSVRDIYRKCWSGLADRESVLNACDVLQNLGHLKLIKTKNTQNVVSEKVALHPIHRKG